VNGREVVFVFVPSLDWMVICPEPALPPLELTVKVTGTGAAPTTTEAGLNEQAVGAIPPDVPVQERLTVPV